MSERIITAPRMGEYTLFILSGLQRLGFKTLVPPPTRPSTIAIGVRAMHELMCLPAKIGLGNMVQAAEAGATDVVMWDSCGTCRLKCYYHIQQQNLQEMGCRIKVHPMRMKSLVSDIRQLNPSLSPINILSCMWNTILQMHEYDRQLWGRPYDGKSTRIGLMGEIFTINDPATNMDIVKRLQKLGAHVDNPISMSHLIFSLPSKWNLMPVPYVDDKVWKWAQIQARKQFPNEIGGHGNDSVTAVFYFHALGYDGSIHLLPFPCMPEATVAQPMDYIAKELNFPLMRLVFDEHSGDAGLDTRLEAFVDMLQFRKRRQVSVARS